MRRYRPEVDGLRALAVVPVILFHLGIKYFSGGFVGVDIFFVISGFLITQLIVEEVNSEVFSLANFYRRRVRRIFPNLFAMVSAVTICCLFVLIPYDMKVYGESLAATSVSLSNVFFWEKAGYFDTLSADSPLLHTWSLGVEEQYYIVFPIVVILLLKSESSP